MKRILLICTVLLISAGSRSFAQTYGITLDPKTAFTVQVTNFDAFVAAGNITSANKSMDTMMMMMDKQVEFSRRYMYDNHTGANPTLLAPARKKYTDKMSIQNKIKGYRSNPTLNKTKIDTECANFLPIWD